MRAQAQSVGGACEDDLARVSMELERMHFNAAVVRFQQWLKDSAKVITMAHPDGEKKIYTEEALERHLLAWKPRLDKPSKFNPFDSPLKFHWESTLALRGREFKDLSKKEKKNAQDDVSRAALYLCYLLGAADRQVKVRGHEWWKKLPGEASVVAGELGNLGGTGEYSFQLRWLKEEDAIDSSVEAWRGEMLHFVLFNKKEMVFGWKCVVRYHTDSDWPEKNFRHRAKALYVLLWWLLQLPGFRAKGLSDGKDGTIERLHWSLTR